MIFNEFLKQGQFPDQWKTSYITVFKSKWRQLVNNYKPVCAINAFAKLFESIEYVKQYDTLSHVIFKNQHGFMKQRSVITNLLNYSNIVTETLSRGAQLDVIYYDFAKAFDCVDHTILMRKLRNNGVSGLVLQCIKSYISNRNHSVRIVWCITRFEFGTFIIFTAY